ncbi:MAG: helix-turn-helix transcriptional regulator [Rhizobacter sp.]|nr:helix-turn-helix transcriptional regulator [Ferruginibacter sp.]
MSFGTRLKMLRVKYRLDQDRMSKRLNVSQPVYSRYENDEKHMEDHHPFVQRVAEEFNISMQWLTSTDDDDLPVGDNNTGHHTTFSKIENNFTVPGEFIDIMLKQHELSEQILKLLTKK